MSTSIVVLTLDRALSQLIGIKKTFFVPSDLRKKYPDMSVVSYLANSDTTAEDLVPYLTGMESSGIVLLCDNRLAHLVPALGTPLFTVIFDHTLGGKPPHNYFGMILSKILKAFAAFEARFNDQKMKKLLVLPLRNFWSAELRQLHGLFRNGVVINEAFANSVDQLLSALRGRQRPKTDRNYGKRYVVDDQVKYFEYGHERHAQLETGVPPHNPLCAVAGIFRFGKRYDANRHFNVSRQGEDISGIFYGCHDDSAARGPCSHVNMFPNDFFGAN